MRLLVISDSHGNRQKLSELLAAAPPFDAIAFLGDGGSELSLLPEDKPLYIVKGNCDIAGAAPLSLTFCADGKKVFLCHGHQYHVKSDLLSLMYAAEDADIVLYGHTHIPSYEWRGKNLFLCPGAVNGNRLTRASGYALIEWEEGKPPYPVMREV